jgi:hypothetical protein
MKAARKADAKARLMKMRPATTNIKRWGSRCEAMWSVV